MSYMDKLQTVNQQGGFQNLLKKALNSASNSGGALIPQHLEKIITNAVQRLSPTISMIQPEYDAQGLHEFNRVTSLGDGGGFQGENAVTPGSQSVFARANVTLKVVRRKGSVTDYLRLSSEKFVDALATEIENQVRAQVYDLESLNIYGSATADAYQYDGWDHLITTNRFNDGFTSGAATVPASNAFLDKMIDASLRKGSNLHPKAFLMTPEMLSLVSRYQTEFRKMIPMDEVNTPGGWRLPSYRGIPIISSTFLSGVGSSTMGTVTAASGGTTGGSLSNGTYYFRVAAITQDGEQMASAESSVTLSGGTATQKITLSFTAVSGAISYKVYYSATTGLTGMTLIDQQAARAYDGSGTPGAASTSLTVLAVSATSAVSGMTSDKPLTTVSSVNPETVWLIDFDKYQGLGKFPINNPGGREGGIISIEPLAKTDAFMQFLLYTHGAIAPSFEATSVLSRGWRVA